MSKYIVIAWSNKEEEIKIEVEGTPMIDSDGYLSFGKDNFVFNIGSWSYYYKKE